MNEMIERVAKALYPHFFNMEEMRKHTTEPAILETQEHARVRARTAIEAMREPTGTMLADGMSAADDALDSDYSSDMEGNRHEHSYLRSDAPASIYRAMIDSALGSGE